MEARDLDDRLHEQLIAYAEWLETLLGADDRAVDVTAGSRPISVAGERVGQRRWPVLAAVAATVALVVAGLLVLGNRQPAPDRASGGAGAGDVTWPTEMFRLDLPDVEVRPAPSVVITRTPALREYAWADPGSSPVRYMALAISDGSVPAINPPPDWVPIDDAPDGKAWTASSEAAGDPVTQLVWRRESGQMVAANLDPASLVNSLFSSPWADGEPYGPIEPSLTLQPQALDRTQPAYGETWVLDGEKIGASSSPLGLSDLLLETRPTAEAITVGGRSGFVLDTFSDELPTTVTWPLAGGYWGVLQIPDTLLPRLDEIVSHIVIETRNDQIQDHIAGIDDTLLSATTAPPPTAPPTSVPATTVPASSSPATSPDEQVYTVVPGDSLGVIARLHGITVDELALYNGWAEGASHVLFAGDVIRIPPGSRTYGAGDTDDIGRIPYLAIGDTVMLGASALLTERGFTVDAVPSRQMADAVALLHELDEADAFGEVVVVHLGTNGPIDADTLDAVLAALVDVPDVVILNVFADRPWTEGNNQLLEARDQDDDNVTLIDWNTLAGDCPGACFAEDGIHLTPEGNEYYADVIGDLTGR
jgi:LysM repeat protein